jgi:hypothetical protein
MIRDAVTHNRAWRKGKTPAKARASR